ncbi:ComF family protein [Parerythrobacter aurantius]|uniref:double zinc ribbon domain-containing protein n=1 Tax=Parerythrobacter aurantius TaxID=3127706 RepID=UPI00324950F1
MNLLKQLSSALRPITDLLYPPRCPLCGDGIEAQTGLCTACWHGLLVPSEPCCAQCQRPIATGPLADALCASCLATPPKHSGIAAATIYNDTSRQLVLRFKHGGRISLATVMARQMVAQLGPVPVDALLVPVPLHRWRLWRRGYNQAALLAHEIARLTDRETCVDALLRIKPTPALGGLGRKARQKALAGAVTVNPRRRELIARRPVILVDDVLTSGATTAACTRVLLRDGASSVRIACFARVLEEGLPRTARTAGIKTPEATGTSGAS